ncbi:MAG: response regulator transcription factor, partial [Flavobacteriales bacterium]
MAIDIVIVDDHELVANGIAKYFEDKPEYKVIGKYYSPQVALEKIELLQPDIVLSDLDMPGLNGLEMISVAKQKSPQTKFVLLTMHLSKQLYQKAKQLGVEGYLPKSTDEEELFMCIAQLVKGKTYYSQKLM